jgi:ABC-2 type transport system permease protein
VLVRLKGRLLRNAVGADLARQLTLAASIVVGGLIAFAGFLAMVSVRLSAATGPSVAVLACAALLVGWLLFPLLGFGSDETLDPARLALFPIPRRTLMLGLFGASLVGVPAVATVAALSGAVVGYGGGLGTPLVVATVLALLAVCVTGSRAVVTLLAAALRSRRGRDSAILGVTLAGAFVYASQLLLPRGDPGHTSRNVRAAAAAIRYTPLGWAGDALAASRDGRYGVALLEVLGLLAMAAAFTWVWSWALDRAVTTAASSGPVRETGGGDVRPRLLAPLLPRGPLGAVTARELRYLVREPRRRATVISGAVFATTLPLVAMRGAPTGARPFTLLYPAVILGLSGANHFGLDGPAWWLHLSAGVAPRTDLAARNLALLAYALPILVAESAVMVALGTPPGRMAGALAVALGAFGIAVAFADVASVRAPYAVPESTTNPWATNSNAGCAAGLYSLLAMGTSAIALSPSIALVVLSHGRVPYLLLAVVLALAVGGAAVWAGLSVAARDLDHRGPHILASIDPKRA